MILYSPRRPFKPFDPILLQRLSDPSVRTVFVYDIRRRCCLFQHSSRCEKMYEKLLRVVAPDGTLFKTRSRMDQYIQRDRE